MLASLFVAAPTGAATKPNVVLLIADDMNDWVTPLGGHPQTRTPNLETLARRGTLFTNAHTAAPACKPARAAMWSGMRPATTGMYLNGQDEEAFWSRYGDLFAHFAANGYRTYGSGKIFHSPARNAQVFDVASHPFATKSEGATKQRYGDINVGTNRASELHDVKVSKWAQAELAKPEIGQQPFLMALGFFTTHLPWVVPAERLRPFPPDGEIILPTTLAGDLDDLPTLGRRFAWATAFAGTPTQDVPYAESEHKKVIDAGGWKIAVRHYLAAIHFVDRIVGEIIEVLEAQGLADDTIIVFTSDHGWQLGEKQSWRKFALWETATRVPMIVVAPHLPGGRRTHRPVNLLDVFPTLVDLAAIDPPAGLEGRSLVPLLQDPAAGWEAPTLTTYDRNNHAVRDDRHRYIRYSDGGEELYDHESDPDEFHNLAGDPTRQDVKSRLAGAVPTTNAPPL